MRIAFRSAWDSSWLPACCEFVLISNCYYNLVATWDEKKRLSNLNAHGLDFAGCEAIWDDFMVTREDVREKYPEQRFVVFGRLNGWIVVLVHVERRGGPHIISLRKAEKYETRYNFEEAQKYFGQNG